MTSVGWRLATSVGPLILAPVLLVGGSFAQVVPPRRAPSAMFIHLGEQREIPVLTAAEAGVAFDIDADGRADQVAWTDPHSNVALLAMDVDGDGRISSGRELFGSHMIPEAGNGPKALLKAFERSGAPISGAVQDGDSLFERILLWIDANHNGLSEAGELRLAKERFTRIGLGFVKQDQVDEHGNRLRFRGWAELRTSGPEQRRATNPRDHTKRLRFYYEFVLGIRR